MVCSYSLHTICFDCGSLLSWADTLHTTPSYKSRILEYMDFVFVFGYNDECTLYCFLLERVVGICSLVSWLGNLLPRKHN